MSWCAYVEELAKVSGTVSLMAAYVKLVSLPLLLAGAEEQKARVLRGCWPASMLGSFALVGAQRRLGPGRARDARRAPRRPWVLNGAKRFIGNAGSATSTSSSPARATPGGEGVSAFLVDGHAEGVS